MVQLRHAAQRIADRIDELALGTGPAHETVSQTAFRSFCGLNRILVMTPAAV